MFVQSGANRSLALPGNVPNSRSVIAHVRRHLVSLWFVLLAVILKNRCHNHVNTKTLYTALQQCKELLSESVLSMLDAFGQNSTETKRIVSNAADTTGLPISTQQTKAQRDIFGRWGDTLSLDWTHNCSNLGFYVSTLKATVATGRGVSVLDYLCLSQQKESLLAVLQWFKKKNPSWGWVAKHSN
ncbi:hypothetical protein PI124_g23744 [Phytophthora idaei]|nr:hypothetical protein PI125_g25527 [Phytophthora idaei]KAG3231161.1 hypothetical protein PI124_g23744 [Phytophthora idaei]